MPVWTTFIRSLSFMSILSVVVQAVAYCADDPSLFCIAVKQAGDLVHVTLTSSYNGWIGVAFNSTYMGDSGPVFVAWPGLPGGPPIVSQRAFNGKGRPVFKNAIMGASVPASGSISFAGGYTPLVDAFSVSFDVPRNVTGTAGSLHCLWAVSPTGPEGSKDANAVFHIHQRKAGFVLELQVISCESTPKMRLNGK